MNNPYQSHWGEWARRYGIGADFLNWGEPAKFTCAVHTGKGKGQGSKGEPNLRTDTVGGDF